ncbi:hypothetical protein ABBQ32_011918 [Trebouxia sp. C0010 RCD-2024]
MTDGKDGRKQKRRYIQFKADKVLKGKPGLGTQSRGGQGAKFILFDSFTRYLSFVHFAVFCLLSLLKAVAPWALACLEAVSALLTYMLLVPCAIPVRCGLQQFHYALSHSLEDVVLLSLLRAAAIVIAYLCGSARSCKQHYLYTAIISAAVTVPFLLIKASIFDRPSYHPAAIFLLLDFLGFSLLHILVARKVVGWTRNRYKLGLLGQTYPWQGKDVVWQQLQHQEHDMRYESESGDNTDVPASQLADKDSLFVEIDGLKVHYKQAYPAKATSTDETAIVLVHGFGAGVFAWRNVMQPLADGAGCRVIAFDRPAFGLTARPAQQSGAGSRYSLAAQADLILHLCTACSISHVMLMGHADGALLALMAAAAASRLSKDESPHVVIEMHASSPMQRSAAEGEVGAQQQSPQQTTGPLPLVLDHEQPSTDPLQSLPVGNPSQHPLSPHAGAWSSPSTSEDESAPSLNGSFAAPLLQPTSNRLMLLRSASSMGGAGSVQSPSHCSSQHRHRRTLSNSQHVCASFSEQSAADLKSDLLAPPSTHSMLPPLPEGAGVQGSCLLPGQCQVEVVALALLHPSVAGEVGPSFTRLLGRSR